MHCPFCSYEDTRVVDSREIKSGQSIRRRRECEHCEGRFTTYETMEDFRLSIVKRDGRKEEYDREKLRAGIAKAFEKRPNNEEKIAKILGIIEGKLQSLDVEALSSRDIGKLVMDELRTSDEVAYIRFASVYKSFGSAASFRKEIDKIDDRHDGK
jgi:transcriptional repressor NrdR